MYFSKFKATLAAAALVVIPFVGQATPLGPGVYDALDDTFLSEGVARSIWTQGGNKIVEGNGAGKLWSFSNAVFDFNGVTAKLTGTATNIGNALLTFDFALNFNSPSNGPVIGSGYCQFDGSGNPCVAGDTSASIWTYFNFLGGTFTGTGTVMSGLSYAITDHSSGNHPPQAGLEANALKNNAKEGFSMWFGWEKSGSAAITSGYTFNSMGNGDINTNLQLDPNKVPSPVPLPAAGFLLIGALGALGAMRFKRKAA